MNTDFFDGGAKPLATLGWPSTYQAAINMKKYSLDYIQCLRCSHIWNCRFDYKVIPYTDNPNRMFNDGGLWQEYIKKMLDRLSAMLPPDPTVIDVGCGEGRHIFGILNEFEDIHCYGLDQDVPSLDKCKEGLEFFKELDSNETIFLQGSIYELPFEENFFDLIICSEVLEHLDDYHAALKEIHRVLKPMGKFLPSVPSYWPEKICWFLSKEYQNMPGGHVRIFKKKQLIKEISSYGFSYDVSERFHGLHSAYWWLRCMFWRNQDSNFLVKIYKKMLERHILKKPFILDRVDRLLNPLMGKSFSMYFEK